jgi:hypothetical protein
MHDCVKTRERLVDLLFDELGTEERRRALAEIEGCHDCLAQYRSMTETLRLFDQAVETAMPDEAYWPGYETRLRERLRHVSPGWKRRLAEWFGGFRVLTARPLQLAVGLAIILLAIGWWGWRQRQALEPSPTIAKGTPTPQPKVDSVDKDTLVPPKEIKVPPSGELAENNKKFGVPPSGGPAKAGTPNRIRVRREERGVEIANNEVGSGGFDQPLIAASLFTPETISHFEKAQLMLRSFRNSSVAKAPGGRARIDLDYERQLSRRLLYQNILLRRDAEMNGDLPAEEALSGLEPFLLDIANLPDRPSPDDLRDIKERLRRKELIASLQIASAQPLAPAYQTP